MLSRDDLRPRLKLPKSWVAVPDGVLLWPDTPFSTKREAEREPKPAPEYMGGLEVGKAQATQGISRLELTSELIAPSVPVKHRLSLANQRHHRNLVVRPQSKVSCLKVSWRGRRLSRLLCTGRSWN